MDKKEKVEEIYFTDEEFEELGFNETEIEIFKNFFKNSKKDEMRKMFLEKYKNSTGEQKERNFQEYKKLINNYMIKLKTADFKEKGLVRSLKTPLNVVMLSNKINEMYGDLRYYLTKLNDELDNDELDELEELLDQLKEDDDTIGLPMIENIKYLDDALQLLDTADNLINQLKEMTCEELFGVKKVAFYLEIPFLINKIDNIIKNISSENLPSDFVSKCKKNELEFLKVPDEIDLTKLT